MRWFLLSVLSRRRDLIEVLSALLRGEAQIVGEVLELAYCRVQEMGRLSPPESVTGFSIKFIVDWTVLQIMSGDLG